MVTGDGARDVAKPLDPSLSPRTALGEGRIAAGFLVAGGVLEGVVAVADDVTGLGLVLAVLALGTGIAAMKRGRFGWWPVAVAAVLAVLSGLRFFTVSGDALALVGLVLATLAYVAALAFGVAAMTRARGA